MPYSSCLALGATLPTASELHRIHKIFSLVLVQWLQRTLMGQVKDHRKERTARSPQKLKALRDSGPSETGVKKLVA